jgi:hypothetical protein
MELTREARRLGGVLSDITGRPPEEVGVIVFAALVAISAVTAVRTVDLVNRVWVPSGRRT